MLDADEFKRWDDAVIFQTELDNFPNPLHERVEVLGLSMTAPQDRNGSDIVPLFVALNNNRELARGSHRMILTRRKPRPANVRLRANHGVEEESNALKIAATPVTYHPSFSKNKQIVSIPR